MGWRWAIFSRKFKEDLAEKVAFMPHARKLRTDLCMAFKRSLQFFNELIWAQMSMQLTWISFKLILYLYQCRFTLHEVHITKYQQSPVSYILCKKDHKSKILCYLLAILNLNNCHFSMKTITLVLYCNTVLCIAESIKQN